MFILHKNYPKHSYELINLSSNRHAHIGCVDVRTKLSFLPAVSVISDYC